VCPIQVNCSHSDYANLQSRLAEKERIIQEQAQRIRDLENKPPVVETKIQIVEKEVVKGECLEMIKRTNLTSLEQNLGIKLSESYKEKINNVNNYQQLTDIRSQVVKNFLAEKQTNIKTTQPNLNERIIWLSLLAVSLLIIGRLLVKLKNRKGISKKNSF
jgi:F0F1-type ATP synthase alpha subunit